MSGSPIHRLKKREDLAGGRLPSGQFGANAAWWAIVVLAFNLNSAMKQLARRDRPTNRPGSVRAALADQINPLTTDWLPLQPILHAPKSLSTSGRWIQAP